MESTPHDATPAQALQSVQADTPQDLLKPRAQYRHTDLPAQVQMDHRWAKKFLPTMMLWAGGQENVWNIPDAILLPHIQMVFDAVYLELNLTVIQGGAIFSLVRLSFFFSQLVHAYVLMSDLNRIDCPTAF